LHLLNVGYNYYNDPQRTSYHTGAYLVCGGRHGVSVFPSGGKLAALRRCW
jgi:hypothetical protein